MTGIAPRPKPALQRRSERTLKAIIDATVELLGTRDLEQLTMADIAKSAGIAVGSIYRRFENREALIGFLLEETLAAQVAELRQMLAEQRWSGVGLADRLDWLVERYQEVATNKPGLLRAILIQFINGTGESAERARARNAETVDLLTDWLLECCADMRGAAEEEVVRATICSLAHATQLALLYPFSVPGISPARAVSVYRDMALGMLSGERTDLS